MDIIFTEDGNIDKKELKSFLGLTPDTQYYGHFLYEVFSPRRLETLHVTNKPDASTD